MEVNGSTSMAAMEAYRNKAETDKQILDKTLGEKEATEKVSARKQESEKEKTLLTARQAETTDKTETQTRNRVDFRV